MRGGAGVFHAPSEAAGSSRLETWPPGLRLGGILSLGKFRRRAVYKQQHWRVGSMPQKRRVNMKLKLILLFLYLPIMPHRAWAIATNG